MNLTDEAQALPACFVGKTDLLKGTVLSARSLEKYTTYLIKN